MAESSLTINLSVLRTAVIRFMGYGEPDIAWAAVNAGYQADVTSIIASGMRQFYTPEPVLGERRGHEWSFLRKSEFIELNAPSAPTQTVTVVAGVGTMTGGTLATWIAGGVARLNGAGVYHHIDTRDSDTQFTLNDTSVSAAALSTVRFYDHIKDLPDDFGGVDGAVTYDPGQQYQALQMTSDARIRVLAQQSANQGPPSLYAIRPRTWPASGTSSTRHEIMFFPFPDAAYAVQMSYKVLAGALAGATDVPLGGAGHSETLISSCLAIAEQYGVTQKSNHRETYLRHLTASVVRDRGSGGGNLGYNRDRSDDTLQRWVPIRNPNMTTTYTP